VVSTKYGQIIVNRYDRHNYQSLKHSGIPHIDDEICKICEIVDLLPPDAVVVDGGANMGLITLPVAKRLQGMVHSFEPQHMLYNCLCGTLALNAIENVTVHRLALSDRSSDMTLPIINYHSPRDFGNVILRKTRPNRQIVRAVRLDDVLPQADFIKLDVETMELRALHGAEQLISNCRPWCWVEYIRSDMVAICAFFTRHDYRCYRVDSANLVAAPRELTRDWMHERLC
jgi:FkbM family methyltransferase